MPRKLRILILFLFLFGLAAFGGYRGSGSGYQAGLQHGYVTEEEVILSENASASASLKKSDKSDRILNSSIKKQGKSDRVQDSPVKEQNKSEKTQKPSEKEQDKPEKVRDTSKKKPVTAGKQDIAVDSYSEGDAMEVLRKNEADHFSYEVLSREIKERITGRSYGKNCDVPYGELRYVRVLYWGFDNTSHKGELIVNKTIAEDIVEIFKELYENKYPIERMVLVDEYDADDNTSMAADNTSAFNYRNIEGTSRISMHSYGLAIDINPLYNPYVRKKDDNMIIAPENAAAYTDRTADCEYYIKKDDVCYNAFIKRGFTWGGEWKTLKDYQHFQKEPES